MKLLGTVRPQRSAFGVGSRPNFSTLQPGNVHNLGIPWYTPNPLVKHHMIRYYRILDIPVASSSLSFPHQTVKTKPFSRAVDPMSIHRCQLPRLASLRYMLPRLRYYLTTVRPRVFWRLFSYPENWCRRETNSTKDAFSRTYQWANGKPNATCTM